jgi:hypothetical protein
LKVVQIHLINPVRPLEAFILSIPKQTHKLNEPSHFLTDKYSFSDIYKKEIPEGIIMDFDTPIKRVERDQNPPTANNRK